MNFQIGIKEKKQVCRNAFRYAYGVSRDYLNTICQDVKRKKESVVRSLNDCSNPMASNDPNFKEYCTNIEKQMGITLSPDQLAARGIPNTAESMQCWSWMKYYFNLVGDFEPNTDGEIHLDCCDITDI